MCGYEFETQSIHLGDEPIGFFDPMEMAKRQFPNREIPPYPYGGMGDMMPTLFECRKCKKLEWTLEHTHYMRGLCYNCSNQTVTEEE